MANRKSLVGSLLAVGAVAAAAAAVYCKRDEIRSFLDNTAERLFGEADDAAPCEEPVFEEEVSLVIDTTAEDASTTEEKEADEA